MGRSWVCVVVVVPRVWNSNRSLDHFVSQGRYYHTRRSHCPPALHSNSPLQGLHAHRRSELLKDDKLKGGGGSESRPDGHEAAPQRQRTLLPADLNEAVGCVVVDLGIGGLVH